MGPIQFVQASITLAQQGNYYFLMFVIAILFLLLILAVFTAYWIYYLTSPKLRYHFTENGKSYNITAFIKKNAQGMKVCKSNRFRELKPFPADQYISHKGKYLDTCWVRVLDGGDWQFEPQYDIKTDRTYESLNMQQRLILRAEAEGHYNTVSTLASLATPITLGMFGVVWLLILIFGKKTICGG